MMVGSRKSEKLGLAYASATATANADLLIDETWIDAEGRRHVEQEIFDSVFEIIDEAEQFILIDFFLVNDFFYQSGPCLRQLSQMLTDKLSAKRKANPNVRIIFITDPVNSVYGSVESSHFKALEHVGIEVFWTNLDRLRDSNPIYSKPWRLLVKPWGIGPGDAIANPIGEGTISIRSMLKLLNFKANHRKVIVTEKTLLVTSANPHDASSAHWNTALRVDGAGMAMACEAESAILRMSGAEVFSPEVGLDRRASRPSTKIEGSSDGRLAARLSSPKSEPFLPRLELLTERKIKDRVLELLNQAKSGARIDLVMFYLSDQQIIAAFIKAKKRGCDVRVILDPNKDSFGRIKNGIPNRQTAARLVKAGIPLRWADTHGEQCHVKMLYVVRAGETATLLLGSCNFTRRNVDNFNAELDVALTAPANHEAMARARDVFERWWSNPNGRIFTTDYTTYEDPSLLRKVRAWLMEETGMSSF